MAPPKFNVFKYGMPLYGAAWPSGDIIFVVGGGGHGIKNRLVFARYQDGLLSDQIGEYNFGEDCPTRLAVTPDSKHLLVAVGSGGLQGFELDSAPAVCPNIVPIKGSTAAALAAIQGEVKVLQFNSAGDLLAVGCEDGSLSVFSWPAVEEQFSLSGESRLKDAVRDIDFSPSHGDAVAALVCQNGTCEVWELRQKRCLCKLQLQKEMERPSFSKCRWSRDGSGLLYTLVNNPKGAHVAVWDVGVEGPVSMRLRQHALMAKDAAGTAFAISPNGALLALGTSEGGVVVCNNRLRPLKRANKVHMVFTTDIAISDASDAVLSVSADAGAHVLELQPAKGKGAQHKSSGGFCSGLLQLLLTLLFMLGLLAGLSYLLDQPPVRELLPPDVLSHADRIKSVSHYHINTGIQKGQEWWESEETQQMVQQGRERALELWEKAKPVARDVLSKLNVEKFAAVVQQATGMGAGSGAPTTIPSAGAGVPQDVGAGREEL